MSVCISCGSDRLITPPTEAKEPSALFKGSTHWCAVCWDYTEAVSSIEYKKGYNLDDLYFRLIRRAIKGNTLSDASKVTGVGIRKIRDIKARSLEEELSDG